ncbi:type II secretion system minor pseudopilin GspK [Jannaschia sp.]|nr:type II secretion system minor pseudopilin GspK [Jannaschia sp.]
MRRDAGFVLINALILVAAMAAAAILLLSRAEGGRARLGAAQEARILTANLDAYDAYARAVLRADQQEGAMDTPGDAWARPSVDLPLAQGTVSGQIVDMQGRFNLNWVSAPDDEAAVEALRRLFSRLGLAPQQADAVIAYLSPGGPSNRAAYAELSPPVNPLGGSIVMLDQLAALPELEDDALDRLRTHVAVLPGRSRVNLNTADATLLAVLLPDVAPARLDAAAARRLTRPYASVEAFFSELGISIDPEVEGSVDASRYAVGSRWFAATSEARLDGRLATRRTVIRRGTPIEGPQVEWRVTRFESPQ